MLEALEAAGRVWGEGARDSGAHLHMGMENCGSRRGQVLRARERTPCAYAAAIKVGLCRRRRCWARRATAENEIESDKSVSGRAQWGVWHETAGEGGGEEVSEFREDSRPSRDRYLLRARRLIIGSVSLLPSLLMPLGGITVDETLAQPGLVNGKSGKWMGRDSMC